MKTYIYIIIITHVHLCCCLYIVCFLIAYACVMCALELMQIFTCIYTYEYPKSRTHTYLVHVQYGRMPLHFELLLKPTEPEVMIALLHACPDTASKPNWVRLNQQLHKYATTYICIYIKILTCMSIPLSLCIYVHIYVHTYTYIIIYMYMCICMHEYIYVRIYTYICIYVYTYTHTHEYIYIYTYAYIYTNICRYTYIQKYITTYIGMYINILYVYSSRSLYMCTH